MRPKRQVKPEVAYDYFKEEIKEPQKKFEVPSEADCQHSMAPPDKYYKKFDFFYKRTCFRLMAEFYKMLFQPF